MASRYKEVAKGVQRVLETVYHGTVERHDTKLDNGVVVKCYRMGTNKIRIDINTKEMEVKDED
ncbi:MAG: hypothetical protein LC100_09885 [Chitinophagales bacterium]|nr:hypothetical protein [Chitinophagales bacterium]